MLISPPPPPPPGSHGRRLAELLEEQQEPFALEVYLLEKGYYRSCCCSEPLVSSSQATAICRWPMDACDGLLRRLHASNAFGRRRRIEKRCHRLLKSLLAKLLNPKAVRKALKGARDNRVLHFSGALDDDGGDVWKWREADDSNQSSPVSVLDHSYAKEEDDDISAMEVDPPSRDRPPPFIQLSNSSRQVLDESEKLLKEEEEEEEEEDLVAWKKKMEGVEVESIRQLALADISMSKRDWYGLHPVHAREIAMQIEEAIFEDIKGDVILLLLGLV